MPASSPWWDNYAPAQWTQGTVAQGDSYAATGYVGGLIGMADQGTGFDTTLHLKLAGAIILALVVVFGLQMMGFRFVVAANSSVGIGK